MTERSRRSTSIFVRNWRESDDPFWVKVGQFVRNRVTTPGVLCCGHPGQPGC